MKKKYRICILFTVIFTFYGMGQSAFANNYSDEINAADKKVILEQYEEAKEIYKKIIKSADFSVVEAYAHYKLGALYKRQHELGKAKEEYQKGIISLKKAGESKHQIGKYLAEALLYTG
ncbi:MAG: hypothetical protein JKY59_00795 [Emcibacter sp.]|nr:hypothetical protein [Emcibacter sp.]